LIRLTEFNYLTVVGKRIIRVLGSGNRKMSLADVCFELNEDYKDKTSKANIYYHLTQVHKDLKLIRTFSVRRKQKRTGKMEDFRLYALTEKGLQAYDYFFHGVAT